MDKIVFDSPKNRRRLLKFVVALAVSALLILSITGCLKAEEAVKKPILIGASVSATGKYAKTGLYQKEAFLLWEKEVNARGGLLGREVKFIIYDDKSDPTTGAKLYEKLITEDKVDLVFGPYSSPVTSAVSTVTEKYGYPTLAPGSAATTIWERGYKYIFQIYSPDKYYMDGVIEIASKNGLKTVAVINEDTAFAKGAAQGAIDSAKEVGMQVVFHEEYARDTPDYSPLLIKIKTLNPDVIIGGTYLPDAVQITRQAKDLDVNPKMLAFTVGPALPEFYESLGKDAEYVYGSTQWEPILKTPGNEKFVNDYRAMWNRDPDYHSAGGYAACEILEKAIKQVGSLDKEKLRETMAQMDTKTVFGGYKVDETGLQVGHGFFIIQWQEGKKEFVWPSYVVIKEVRFPTPSWSER